METRDGSLNRIPRGLTRRLALLALATVSQSGCGREFFREWANQDVSEAVYEKSRDPRWRLDMFSVDPPALARHSDPYDPDRPPAPPDDYASEATSPVPQWPDNRLLVPAEGTGYLDMLESWQRKRAADRTQDTGRLRTPTGPRVGTGLPPTNTAGEPNPQPPAPPVPPVSGSPSPFTPAVPSPNTPDAPAGGPNSGPNGGPMTPIPIPDNRPSGSNPSPPQTQTRKRDLGVTLSAFQQTGLPMPVPTPAVNPRNAPATRSPSSSVEPPPIGMDPDPNERGSDLSAPITPPPGQTAAEFRANEAVASELAGILVAGAVDFDESEAAGLPRDFRPYVLTMDQAFTLTLINSRIYQFQLEQVYIASLAVTLQRFAFTPQFYAGAAPLLPDGVAGGGIAGTNFANSFNYATRATGAPVSNLNIGTVAGAGKLFNSGARVVAGFANQVVFNFIGHNSVQPRVQSLLPMTIVQPFLRGGGRAVTLEALTQAERSLLYTIRSFAKFRQEFTVQTLIGGSIVNFGSAIPSIGFSGVQSNDPNIGFVNIVEDVQLLENNRRNIAAFEQILKVYKELVQGESSGISQLQVDQIDQSLQQARQAFINARLQYRSDLDQFKQQMGLPPDTPIIPDRRLTRDFKRVYADIDEWQGNPKRDLKTLPEFANRLPKLQDVVLDGRSVLGVYKEGKNDEDELEDLLLTAERTAMEHRLDLMNQRAGLYDAWRQIKVTANALQGVFNLSLTNQFVTPPTTSNPFGFVDQAKQFSLVINAELPLVRLAERNTFRQALIAYQRQRRSLQNTEDSIKNIVRQDVRLMQQQYLLYEIYRKNLVLTVRLKDQAFEQIIAPPAQAGGASQAPLQTTNLVNFQSTLLGIENALVSTWYQYQINRLQLYRDLGTLPIDEWEAFHELFPSEPHDSGATDTAALDAESARITAARLEAEPATVGR